MLHVSPDVDLASLSDQEFRAVIDGYLRGDVPETTVQMLRGPLLERVIDTLQAMIRSVTTQLDARAHEPKENEILLRLGRITQTDVDMKDLEYGKWRVSAVRFRGRLEEALATHERMLRRTRVEELERAIAAHRDARLGTASTADQRLWSVLHDDR